MLAAAIAVVMSVLWVGLIAFAAIAIGNNDAESIGALAVALPIVLVIEWLGFLALDGLTSHG